MFLTPGRLGMPDSSPWETWNGKFQPLGSLEIQKTGFLGEKKRPCEAMWQTEQQGLEKTAP